MTALAKVVNSPTPPAETASILAVIERAAQNPAVDMDKMERLFEMHERVIARTAAQAFAEDLARMQSELPSIGERGQADRYKFALWEDMNRQIKPVLQRFGFSLSFRTDFTSGIKVTGVLMHKGGHREETSMVMPADKSGSKNDVQAIGSSVSYGKRYTAGALLNLTSHGEDDDAFATGEEYDATDWLTSINDAPDMDDLNRLAAELKTADIPKGAMKKIRAAWSARAKEIKA